VSVDVIGKVVPLQGDSQDGSDVTAGGRFIRARIGAEGQNEDGSFGGWLRFESPNNWSGSGVSGGTSWGEGVNAWGYVWWKPHDIFKVQIGANPDGHFETDNGITRWNFYQVGGDVGVASEGWAFSESFYGGEGTPGAFLTLAPVEPLAINIAIPFLATGWGEEAKDVYRKLVGQVTYDLGSIGKVALTYKGGLNTLGTDDDGNAKVDASKLWAYFGIRAIENLGIDIGVGYYLPVKSKEVDGVDTGVEITYSKPVALGLGVNFNAGALGIKARVQGQFGGNVKIPGTTEKLPTTVTADLLPSFAINDKVSALLDTGLVLNKEDGADAQVGWHIMPYVALKANAWAPNFYAGFRFDSEGKAPGGPDAVVNWSVPIGIWLSF